MKCAEIRDAFLKYFEKKEHTIVPSSSLVPASDPTLLFTNAGMVQFKDTFLGLEKRSYQRAVSSQRCVRAGGKHNDLENVGYTARHHTFFEMLGNFSFGDYFKEEAIAFAWEFLTEVLKIPEQRLWVTVHVSDDEAADIWLNKVGVDSQRFSRLDEDNFWQMGDTGPCGPCSEIFYDHGENVPGGPPGSDNDDLDRYIEVWNLVFMQYERQADGALVPLPKPSVDTGMGLERIAAVMQGVHNNYEIDLFEALLDSAARVTQVKDTESKSLRVIADHIRSCTFLICDGVMPSNEGRGYVLRRIVRRAVRHGHKLGQTKPFFHKLVATLVEQMGDAYPELVEKRSQVEKVLLLEEEQFAKTLEKGLALLSNKLNTLNGAVIPGELVFKLYDTYGFPADLTNDIAREKDLSIDTAAYERLMDEQRRTSQESGSFKVDYATVPAVGGATAFVGYEKLSEKAEVISIVKEGAEVSVLDDGEEGIIVLNRTPFYGESGGQVGDSGYLTDEGARFEVRDCQKQGDNHLHIGVMLSGSIRQGQQLNAQVDPQTREATKRNHSATHLLHAALRKVLGEHVTQKGSLVDSEKLRFDFSHFEALGQTQLQAISRLVNDEIQKNTEVVTETCDIEGAKRRGAIALFGEKYGDTVRVLSMGGGFSVELCGGTHVNRTGDIGLLRIEAESGIAAGVRRIEATTGAAALEFYDADRQILADAAKALKTTPDKLAGKVEHTVAHVRELEKQLEKVQAKLATASAESWLEDAIDVSGLKLLTKILHGVDAKGLGALVDQLKNKLGSSAVIVATVNGDSVSLAAGVTQDMTKRLRAGDIVKYVAAQIDGKGGGRPDFAQGAGANAEALPKALGSVETWVRDKLAS